MGFSQTLWVKSWSNVGWLTFDQYCNDWPSCRLVVNCECSNLGCFMIHGVKSLLWFRCDTLLAWPLGKLFISSDSNSDSRIEIVSSLVKMWRPDSLYTPQHMTCVTRKQTLTLLKVFVVVIPKEGWARVAAPILLLVWHRLLENIIYEVKRLKF